MRAINTRAVDLMARHHDQANLHVFSDSTLMFGKTRSGNYYTPEHEFAQLCVQYKLNLKAVNISLGATAVNIARSIVSALCQLGRKGPEEEQQYFDHPETMPWYSGNNCLLHVQRLGSHEKCEERIVE